MVLAGEGVSPLVGQVFVQLPGRYMAGDESTPAEQRLHEPEERPAHAVLAGKDASQLVGVPERIGQILYRDIFTVGFQQAGVQQRRDVGQLLAGGQGTDVLDGHKA